VTAPKGDAMAEHNWFMTHTGRKLYVLDPNPDDLVIEDIATPLSRICRFGGHTTKFYSVAQHSVYVSRIVMPGNERAALLHDATEAYLGDIIRPLKGELKAYWRIERMWWTAIARRFRLPNNLPAEVEVADRVALLTEMRDLMPGGTHNRAEACDGYQPDPRPIVPISEIEARAEFVARFDELEGSAPR
jgi:5'-deoxynucleotidase YfbR-like HD superfamily hydrolase